MQSEKKLETHINNPLIHHKDACGQFIIHSVSAGKGNPLVLLHGLNIGWGQWYRNIDSLSFRNHIYALDIPGSGRSTKVDYFTVHFHTIVHALEEFISKKKLKNITLVAHSTGAWFAAQMIHNQRISMKRAILVNPIGITKEAPLHQRFLSNKFIALLLSRTVCNPNRSFVKEFLLDAQYNRTHVDTDFIDYVFESLRHKSSSHPFHLLHRMIGLKSIRPEFDTLAILSESHIPIHILTGAHDNMIHIKELAMNIASYSHISLKIFSSSGHVPFMEEPAIFNKEVLKIISK